MLEPVEFAKVPGGQAMQVVAVALGLCLPARQGVHTPSSAVEPVSPLVAEALLNPCPGLHVAVDMGVHGWAADEVIDGKLPAGQDKTQQRPSFR